MSQPKRHKHEWFPVAIDDGDEFLVIECVECTERRWRRADQLKRDGDDA